LLFVHRYTPSGLQKISARPAERGVLHEQVEMRKFSASLMKSLEAMSVRVSREMNNFALRDGGHDTQRLCISSGGNSKRVTVPRNQTYFEKLNYKFTLNPAIDYALCCVPFVLPSNYKICFSGFLNSMSMFVGTGIVSFK
jgi:hypothetical protein